MLRGDISRLLSKLVFTLNVIHTGVHGLNLVAHGGCGGEDFTFDNTVLTMASSTTANGAPYYHFSHPVTSLISTSTWFLYMDPDCDGAGTAGTAPPGTLRGQAQ